MSNQGSISRSNRTVPPVAPSVTDARNGLSVVSTFVELGGNPLLHDSIITAFETFKLFLQGNLGGEVGEIEFSCPGVAMITMRHINSGTSLIIDVETGLGFIDCANGRFTFDSTGIIASVDVPNAGQVGFFRIQGTLTAKKFIFPRTANTPVSGNSHPSVIFTNEGAAGMITFTLAAPLAGNNHEFYVQNANGITVQASGGATIRIGTSVSAANGTIDSTDVGSTIRLVAINSSEWFASYHEGTWNI